MPNSRLLYVLRTDALSSEARVFRVFDLLERKGCSPHVFALVKTLSEFDFANTQEICRAEKVQWAPLRHVLKFFELQVRTIAGVLRHPETADVIVIANYDLLVAGAALRVVFRRRVVVDLHEHYFRGLFGRYWVSQIVFTKIFSGVIFANRERAVDCMGAGALKSNAVAIIRNFPIATPGVVMTPSSGNKREILRVGIVGGYRPGRFVRESIRSLDTEDFGGRIEIVTFGPKAEVVCDHIELVEHGKFRHDEIEGLTEGIDVSLVFYDPRRSANNLFCEPNRYYQSYNAGKILISFLHSSLESIMDQYCLLTELDDFENSLRIAISDLLKRRKSSGWEFESIERKRVVFDDGIFGLNVLLKK